MHEQVLQLRRVSVTQPRRRWMEAQSGNLAGQSGNLQPLSVNPLHRLAPFPELPAELAEALASLKQRVPRRNWRTRFGGCAHGGLPVPKNSPGYCGRERKYVQDRLLTPMLKSARLETTAPSSSSTSDPATRTSSIRDYSIWIASWTTAPSSNCWSWNAAEAGRGRH